jgi:phospholipid-binding lipoprotein MlaA
MLALREFARFGGSCFVLILLITATGCTSIPKDQRDPRDPFEPFNRAMYTFNDGLDTILLKPVATGYDAALPGVVKTGVSNFFDNIADLPIAVNQLLQGKPQQAGNDLSRFLFNSTFGLAGLIDFAQIFLDLPRHNEDFGQTLGVWGFSTGPYVVLPLFGPRNVRDTFGLGGDIVLDPFWSLNKNRAYWGGIITRAISDRAQLLAAERVLDTAALDPYIFLRESYLQQRENLVYDGNPPIDFDEDEFFDDTQLEDN